MSIDVNEAFDTERASQIAALTAQRDAETISEADKVAWLEREVAAGRMIRLSATRYRVISGWDRGEIWTVNRAAGRLEVIADHGLDLDEAGNAKLYSARPEWHRLGNIVPGGTSSIQEALQLGGIGFEVEKRQVRYSFDRQLHTVEGQFVTVRTDTGAALGVVGSKYAVLQQADVFGFLTDLVATEDVIWETAGSMRGGSKVFVTMRLPNNVVVDPGGLDDEIVPYLNAINSHDGSSPACVALSPWRIRCKNTERFATENAVTRWGIRHTKNALARVEEARRTLGMSVRYFDEFAQEETALARTSIEIADFHKLIADLWPTPADANDKTRGIAERRTERLEAMFRAEIDAVGRTAYAAERTVTDYLDHVAPVRPGKTMTEEIARATRLLEGADDKVKTQAHKRLMLLTR